MKIIDRLKQWRDLCEVYGSEFLFMTDGHKQSYVTDMYSMLRRFFVDEIDLIENQKNEKYCEYVRDSFVDYLAHGAEFIRNPNDIDKFYFIFFHSDSYVAGLMWTKLANYLRRSWSKAEEFSN